MLSTAMKFFIIVSVCIVAFGLLSHFAPSTLTPVLAKYPIQWVHVLVGLAAIGAYKTTK